MTEQTRGQHRARPKWHYGILGVVLLTIIALLAYVGVTRPYTAAEHVPTTVVPEFNAKLKPVAGWRVVVQNPPEATSYYKSGSTRTNRVLFIQDNVKVDTGQTGGAGVSTYYGPCTVTFETTFAPPYLANSGDDFLSRSLLYSQEDLYASQPTRQRTVTVATSGPRGLDFRSAYFRSGAKATKGTGGYEGYYAFRGFDKRYNLGTQVAQGQYGSNGNEGIPVLGISYTCTSKGKLDPKLWPKFLAAAQVLVK